MSLYRANPKDGVAWITGASTGIGRAVALELARQGYKVAVTAREVGELAEVCKGSPDCAGRIAAYPCDVSDEAGMERTVAAIEKDLGPIVLALFNAGIYLPALGERLEATNIVRSFQVNVFGVVYGLVPVLDRMRARGFGQVAVMGSVTSYFGMPSAAAYGATKAALNNMAQSLRFDLEKLNIRIQVFNPGFVATPLTAKFQFPMPALLQVDDASARIAKGLARGGFEIAFPRRFAWCLKVLRVFPAELIHRLLNRATGWHKRTLRRPPRHR